MTQEVKKNWYARVATTFTAIVALVGGAKGGELPIDPTTHKLNFSEDQKAILQDAFGSNFSSMEEALNHELQSFYKTNDNVKAISDEVAAILAEKNALTEELKATDDRDVEATLSAQIKALNAAHAKELKSFKDEILKLSAENIGDSPAAVFTKGAFDQKHSATHLWGIADPYNAFENRPWNARALGGVSATDFLNNAEIPTLNGDLEHFVRKNPDVIKSWFDDFEELPADWARQSGIIDRVSTGSITVGEIAQGRKKGWKPKNKFKFDTEEGRVFRKQIDVEFSGFELQQLETTWVGQIKNMDGSQPWKMNFITYLMSEIAKRQRLDDRMSQINGLYAMDPAEEAAGDNLNSQNGLRFYWWYYRDVVKKYRPFVIADMAAPTPENIVDYIKKMIEQIPIEQRNQQGLEIQLSEQVLKWYREKAGVGLVRQYDSDQGTLEYKLNYPVDYPNYKFQPIKDMTNTLFIGITYSKNVEILDYDISEKSRITIGHEKRNTHIFADYRQGIRFINVGMKSAPGDPAEFEKQILWSNDQPIFSKSITIPAFDDTSGTLNVNYNNIQIAPNFKTDIVDIEGNIKPGMIVRITGNTSALANKYVKDNDKFDLTADFALNSNKVLTLYVNDNLTLTEITRTDVIASQPNEVKFDTTVIDASEGYSFRYNGANATLASITGGVDAKNIKVYGRTGVTLTIANVTGVIQGVPANTTLTNDTHWIQFTYIDGIWRKTKLSNA
jgi:hypothetical protein